MVAMTAVAVANSNLTLKHSMMTCSAFHVHRTLINNNTEAKKQDRLDYLEEGRKVRQRIEDERLKVEKIKADKLNGLKDLGIDNKYQTDLAKKKIL